MTRTRTRKRAKRSGHAEPAKRAKPARRRPAASELLRAARELLPGRDRAGTANVLRVVDQWQDYRAGSEAINNFVDSMLDGIDWSVMPPEWLRVMFVLICDALPAAELAHLSERADVERRILESCTRPQSEPAQDSENQLVRVINALQPYPEAFRAMVALVEAMPSVPADIVAAAVRGTVAQPARSRVTS